MKTLKLIAVLLLLGTTLFAQNQYSQAVGWASHEYDLTGGGDATPQIVTTASELESAIKSNSVVHIKGSIDVTSIKIKPKGIKNLSIIGLPGAKIIQWGGGLSFSSCENVIIRNIIFEGPGGGMGENDNLALNTSKRFWIDHCEFVDASDGNLDITNSSNYVTVTWCKFRYTNKSVEHELSNLIAASDTDGDTTKYKVTMQYCWWAEGCQSRMPRGRFGRVDVVNCYYNSAASESCINSGHMMNTRVEKCHFVGVKNPHIVATTGVLTAFDNIYDNIRGLTSEQGTAFTPPYTNLTISEANDVKALVTDPTCGAGVATTTYTLTSLTSGSGTLATNPSGSIFNAETVVTLTATASVGNEFDSWSGDVTGTTNPTAVTMDADKSVTANFKASTMQYTLSTSVVGEGSVVLSPAGGSYLTGTVVTLTANPNEGKSFSAWSGDLTGFTNPATITMSDDKSVTATFTLCVPAKLTVVSATATNVDGLNIPENLIDDITTTRWSSDVDGAYATLDLGAICKVNSLDIFWYEKSTRTYLFDIMVSADGISYTPFLTGGGSDGLTTKNFNLEDVEVRYVRYVAHGHTAGAWTNLSELVINGCPLTTTKNEYAQADFSFTCYPSPIKDVVTLSVNLPESKNLSVNILDVSGYSVKSLPAQMFNEGSNEMCIDLRNLSSGLYFCTLKEGNNVVTKKIIKE